MTFDLNKYTESSVTLRFDGNGGDVRQYKDHFREVNLWSPLYQQREVVVYVDGANVYGWKGDDDRRHWMEYEYQTVWSLPRVSGGSGSARIPLG